MLKSHYKRAPFGSRLSSFTRPPTERSTLVNSEKYIGLDVHQATISVAVMDSRGKVVMESILETKASTILEFFAGLRGTLSVTFEEGTWRRRNLGGLAVRSAQAPRCQSRSLQSTQER